MQEKWKSIPGYEGLYKCSNLGIIKSLKRKCKGGNNIRTVPEKYLTYRTTDSGYLRVALTKNRITKDFFVHRIIAMAFLRNPENKPFVNHKNGIKKDNRPTKLEWCTQSENEIHAHKYGLKNFKGENHPLSKLSNSDVCKIREMIKNKIKNRNIAHLFKVSESHISNIKSNKIRIKENADKL